jgi:methylmalonyl-CoA mutase N-terminal domain/subunit
VAPDAAREASQALELYAFDATVAEAQVAKLARLRRERDGAAVARGLARLREAARGTENLMEPIIEAVRAYATLGEMAGALREVWGEHKEPLVF